MSRIPTPDRGQPIDVSYIYQIVEAVNELSAKSSSSTYKYGSIDTSDGQQNLLINEAKVVAGEKVIYQTATSVTADTTTTFSYPFKGQFKYIPVVTATPVLMTGTTAGIEARVVITSVTTTSVDGVVKFSSGGSAALKVNLIAVGIPG